MRDKFRNKNGDLTHYALACGYVQEFELQKMSLKLFHDGGTVFHVRLHDHGEGRRIFWQCFETLTAARNYWHQTKANLSELAQMTA